MPTPGQHRAETGRRDDARMTGETRERWQMKMVVVPVRHEDRVHPEIRYRLPHVTGMPVKWPEPIDEARVFPSQHVRLCFLAPGDGRGTKVELVEPTDEESGVARFLETQLR